jgi:hypothetical protein
MNQYSVLAEGIRRNGALLNGELISYSCFHSAKSRDEALEGIKRMRGLLEEAERRIAEDEKQLKERTRVLASE